jgi:DNA-binding MarR family transcriptional regulator
MNQTSLDNARTKFKETWYRIDNLFNRYAKSIGLNFTTILVLEFIYESEEHYTQKDLCEKLMLPKQFMNSMIKSFWAQGFVDLKEAKDRRNKEIILTARGKKYAERILHSIQEAENKVWESFTDEEIAAFVNVMERYEKSFESIKVS